MTVLVDSWAWIEYLRGSQAGEVAGNYIEDDLELIISTINLAEIYRWILRSYDESTAEEKRKAIKDRCLLIDVDEKIAVEAAKLRHNLGWDLGDSLVYATARQKRAEVLTGDSDFDGLEDVIFLSHPR